MGENTLNGSNKSTQFQEELLNFPPRLRKLAFFISKSPEIMSIPEYCQEAGMSYDSIKQGITKSRRKGHDFNSLVNRLVYQKFTSQKPKMYRAVVEEGLKGKYRYVELYFKLCGDLKHEVPPGDTTINSLTFVMAMPDSIPQDQLEEPKEHNGAEDPGVIEAELVRDKEKET
jgi:hypothetical protein